MSRPEEKPDPYRPPDDGANPYRPPQQNPVPRDPRLPPARPFGESLPSGGISGGPAHPGERRRRRGSWGLVAAVVALLLGAVLLTPVVVFFPEFRGFVRCMQGAHTKIAQADCENQFEKAMYRKVGR